MSVNVHDSFPEFITDMQSSEGSHGVHGIPIIQHSVALFGLICPNLSWLGMA